MLWVHEYLTVILENKLLLFNYEVLIYKHILYNSVNFYSQFIVKIIKAIDQKD